MTAQSIITKVNKSLYVTILYYLKSKGKYVKKENRDK